MVGLSLQSSQVFELMRSAYTYGVIDKSLPLVGRSMEAVVAETGLTLEDLLNSMDAAEDRTVRRIDRLLAHAGPLIRLLKSGPVMRMTSRMLDLAVVQKLAVFILSKGMKRSLKRGGGAR